MNTSKSLLALARIYQDYGVDFLLNDVPTDFYQSQKTYILPNIMNTKEKIKASVTVTTKESLASKVIDQKSTNNVYGIKKNVNTSEMLPNLDDCKTLEDLKKIMSDNCLPYLKTLASNMVFASGNVNSKIMFIGEAPGVEEDAQGIPFVGQSGKLLDAILGSIDLNRDNVYITNIVPWRPPANRTPTTTEINACLPYIEKHIELIAPKLIVLLGGTPTKAILGLKDGLLTLRQKLFLYKRGSVAEPVLVHDKKNIHVVASLHPSYLMRSPSQKKLAWHDMLFIKKIIADL